MMTELNEAVYKTVAVVCDQLTDLELMSLRLAVLLQSDPRGVMGYEKVRTTLFSEPDNSGLQNVRMHQEAKKAFLLVAAERLGI